MGKPMSRKQMLKELTPTKAQLKKFHEALRAHGLTPDVIARGKQDADLEK